jgi:signal transduction histidine kinase/ActR/RegA family two-component response regulator
VSEAPDNLGLLIQLTAREHRLESARALARRMGVDHLLLLVRDPDLGVLLPAPGFPQTLDSGPAWRAFVERCQDASRSTGEVDLPPGTRRSAMALNAGEVVAVLIGGTRREKEVAAFERLLPLIGRTLAAEEDAMLARAEAAAARESAKRAHSLASSLDVARREAARLNAELREEQRRKDDFLAMLAHELRNPLAPLATTIELLRRSGTSADGAERQLDVMARQVGQLSRLVEDLLDVSRVSRGRIHLRRERLAVGRTLADSVEAARPLIESRQLTLEVTLPDEEHWVEADQVRLSQIFSNLLHNAAKYTDPGGHVRVSLTADAGEAVVRFTDDGIGIASDALDRIFDLFVQAPAGARGQAGIGIGLTLVRALVKLHGGTVTAESPGLGLGSTFTVRLPLVEAPVPKEAPRTGSRDHEPVERLRVLVVDDNQDAADSLGEILGSLLGHHAEVAYSGAMALQLAADLDPDLLLLDIGMPEMDGYELARRLRRVLRRDAYFVALTGYGSEEDKRRSRDAGFDEHVVKPLMVDALKEVVERARKARAAMGATI